MDADTATAPSHHSQAPAVDAPEAPRRSNLATRLLTAAVAAPCILLLLFLGPPWAWALFIATAALVGSDELYDMTHHGDRIAQIALVLLTEGVFALLWWKSDDAHFVLALVVLLPLVGTLLSLARLGDMKTAALRLTTSTFGPLYLGGGMAMLAMLKRDGGSDGPSFVLLSLMLSWLSDTGAYFAGRAFGKTKLYEAVSPKKTVEGALGGIGGSLVGALLACFLYLPSLPLIDAIGFGVVVGALGQLGDLGESLLKRSVGVKDSGGIVPGHGGILDRVDALLVTSTCAYLYVLFVRGAS